MTYRDVFIQVDPHKVHDALRWYDVEGLGTNFSTEKPFTICKGLKMFANGYRYNSDEQNFITEILDANKAHKMDYELAQLFAFSLYGNLYTALEALGYATSDNPDELVNLWLDRNVDADNEADVNDIAIQIISDLLTKT